MISINQALERIKGNIPELLSQKIVTSLCRDLRLAFRNRLLTPLVTTHLVLRQILARHPMRYQIPDAGIEDLDITASVILERDPKDELSHAIDDNERGLKDTIRVNPNEIVEIAVRFTTYSGRYMYHCHILEHEDRDMMRPFVTMAPELMPFMA